MNDRPSSSPRLRAVRRVAIELAVNVGAPYAVYGAFDKALGDVGALLASSAPPIAWSVFEFVRRRRVDAVSLLVLGGIALSLLAFVGGGSVRFLQLRENLVTGLIGLVFIGSAIVRKPLIYELARASMARKSSKEASAFDKLQSDPRVRRSMSFMTIVWGLGLIAQTALSCALVFAMTIRTYLVVGPIVGYLCIGALALWTVWFVRRGRRLQAAARTSG